VIVVGGAGTIIEIAAAHQNGIPVEALKVSRGTAEQFAERHVDDRKLTLIYGENTSEDAVKKMPPL